MTNTHKDIDVFPGPMSSGMTLRDYFAAKAMQGEVTQGVDDYKKEIAKRAYEYADAMLAAREVTQPDPVIDDLIRTLEDFVSDIDGWGVIELARRYGPAEVVRFRRAKAALARAKEAVK